MTFTVLKDLAGLEVTAHYGIRYWSEFWLLDPGNPNLLEHREPGYVHESRRRMFG